MGLLSYKKLHAACSIDPVVLKGKVVPATGPVTIKRVTLPGG